MTASPSRGKISVITPQGSYSIAHIGKHHVQVNVVVFPSAPCFSQPQNPSGPSLPGQTRTAPTIGDFMPHSYSAVLTTGTTNASTQSLPSNVQSALSCVSQSAQGNLKKFYAAEGINLTSVAQRIENTGSPVDYHQYMMQNGLIKPSAVQTNGVIGCAIAIASYTLAVAATMATIPAAFATGGLSLLGFMSAWLGVLRTAKAVVTQC